MHVAQLLPELNQGGVEQVVLALNRALVRRGHDSTVISAGGELAAQIERDGGRHIGMDVCSKNPLTVPFRVHKLRRILQSLMQQPIGDRQSAIDNAIILHAHSRVPAWLCWLANKKLKLPFVTTVHGFNSVSRYSRIMTQGDRIVCVSHPVNQHIQRHYGTPDEKIAVIHCGIDPDAFNPATVDCAEVERIKATYALHGKRVVSSIGRITGLKDYETFIRACAIAMRTRPDLRGLVVGGVRHDKRAYFAKLSALVRELHMEGFIHFATDLSNMPAVHAASDLVVSCSKKPESFGLTLVEALAMNTPVIATRHGGPLDIIDEGENGFFFEPGDVEALAGLIAREDLAAADLRTGALARFSFEKMVGATLSVYKELVEPIPLRADLLIGQGSHRATYRHPEHADKCLKTVKPGSLEKKRKTNKKWYKRLRKLSSFDETNKEVRAYARFEKDRTALTHIPRFYGMVQTSLGPAMLLELVANEDGTAGRSLASHLNTTDKAKLGAALRTLGKYLVENAIVVRDFSIGDVLVSESRNGDLKLYVCDGLGGKELIPLSAIECFARLKAERRVLRFYRKIMAQHPDLSLALH